MHPFVCRGLEGMTPAAAVSALVEARRKHPDVALVAVLPPNASDDLAAVAREHADGALFENELTDENFLEKIKSVVDSFYAGRGLSGEAREAASLVSAAQLGIVNPASIMDAVGLPTEDSDEVGARIVEIAEPFVQMGAGDAETMVRFTVLAWNGTMLPPDERAEMIKRFGEEVGGPGFEEIASLTMRLLEGRKRDLFPADSRFIVDHEVVPVGDTFSVKARVMPRAMNEITEDPVEPHVKPPPPSPRDHILQAPLVAHMSPGHDAAIRERAIPDPSLTNALWTLIEFGGHGNADVNKFTLTAVFAAIAWNATLLPPDDESRMITDLAARMHEHPLVIQALLLAFAADKHARFADDRRVIALCDVDGTPGNYTIAVSRWDGDLLL